MRNSSKGTISPSAQSRRSFLKTAALAAAGSALPARAWAQVAGANGDVRVGIIGLNGRGRQSHLPSLRALKGVRVVALCDPDYSVLERAKALAGPGVRTFVDVRDLLDMPDLDAVTIATPNHWHSLAAIWACQARKDVYVEKPVCHNIWEGRQLSAAASLYGRVVQAGTQIRSGEGLIEAVAWVRAGNLGKVTAARGFCYKRRDSIGKTNGPQPVPPDLDYNLWSGPAPMTPPRRNSPRSGSIHYDWHWFWMYGNGDIGNQGIHQMDVARWFLGDPGFPRHALSVGGRLGYVDDGETPNTQAVVYDFAAVPLVFEVRGLPSRRGAGAPGDADAESVPMDKYRGLSIGNLIECEGGYVSIGSYFSAQAYDLDGKLINEFKGKDRHMANFIEVVRSRKTDDLYGPIEQGRISSSLCHVANISHRLGKRRRKEELREEITGVPLLAEAFGRMAEHLAANGVDLNQTGATLGATLAIDADSERFTDNDAANALLTREYRPPFEVPRLT